MADKIDGHGNLDTENPGIGSCDDGVNNVEGEQTSEEEAVRMVVEIGARIEQTLDETLPSPEDMAKIIYINFDK
ncbi:hypothetical protein KKD70_03395 [Patescibacteria group bacterium]|nr:hypothetical protein [Patescibacteria group bacterium]